MEKAKFTLQFRPPKSFHEMNVNELAQAFCDQLNPSRLAAGYKPYKVPRINTMLQHLDLWDKKAFYASCLGANNFGSYFGAKLKQKR